MSDRRPLQKPYAVRDGLIRSLQCEVNVTEHCNLACRACSHLSPVQPRHAIDPETVERDLSALAGYYRAHWLRFVGGEPLLHPALPELIRAVRRSRVAVEVCVVTNGVLLPRMTPEFWHEIDRVEVSAYPGKELSAAERKACAERADDAAVDLDFVSIGEFRESYSEPGTRDAALVRRIYASCRLAHVWRNHTVADGRFYKCPPSYFLPKTLRLEGVADGLPIEPGPGFGERLLRFLDSPEPLGSCRNCLGSSGARFDHEQVRRKDFRRLQSRPTEELVDERFLLSAEA